MMDVRRIGWALGALVLCVIIYAWIDGGVQDTKEVVIPVAVPENSE
ncbi:hypothetical protein [Altererythrobacter aquiaggeris]